MNILFRADSSSSIGTGHIMRDLVLASQYKNANIIFAVQDLDGNINQKIKETGYKILILKSNEIKEVNSLINQYRIDMIAIDHYGINWKYEKQLKKQNKDIKILSFDDTYEKHYCDILLNHNIYGDMKKYKNLVPRKCKIRCGNKYTLLREEFIEEKNKSYKKSKNNKTIFLAMGGADHSNININILKVLKKFDKIKVNLVTTNANKNLKELEKYCKNKKWIKLHINSIKIAKLMKKS
ncbi:UDP-2,4-diacetamido-2,4,6-trideoxy-beta-L-altropyranose hydrolase, partial [Sulfurimonas sp. SAG-AH-194-I05]